MYQGCKSQLMPTKLKFHALKIKQQHNTSSTDWVMKSMSHNIYQQWLKAYFQPTPDVDIHNRQLQTLSGWKAAGLGLPLMIIWLLHNEALQLSRAQTLKWQRPPPPPPPAAALISSWAPRAAGLPACCAIWHSEPLTLSLHKSRGTGCSALPVNNNSIDPGHL